MGQKVHPYGFRLGFNKTWRSRWYAEKKYAELLHEDLELRKLLKQRLGHAGVSAIEIERASGPWPTRWQRMLRSWNRRNQTPSTHKDQRPVLHPVRCCRIRLDP